MANSDQDLFASVGRRVAMACLAVVIVAGCAFLWMGLPVAGFWAAGRLTSTDEGFLLFVLGAVPLSMVVGGWVLYRVGAFYEDLRHEEPADPGRPGWMVSLSDERPEFRRRRGRRSLVDVAMATSAITALVVLFVWFFVFAHYNLAPLP